MYESESQGNVRSWLLCKPGSSCFDVLLGREYRTAASRECGELLYSDSSPSSKILLNIPYPGILMGEIKVVPHLLPSACITPTGIGAASTTTGG